MRHLSLAALMVVVLGGCAMQAEGEMLDEESLGTAEDELLIDRIPRPRPNLVAVMSDGTVGSGMGYCDRQDGEFTVRVKNNGFLGAGPSWTLIRGEQPELFVLVETPALAAGETTEIVVNTSGFLVGVSSASFWISVDAANQIIETSEANTFSGYCVT